MNIHKDSRGYLPRTNHRSEGPEYWSIEDSAERTWLMLGIVFLCFFSGCGRSPTSLPGGDDTSDTVRNVEKPVPKHLLFDLYMDGSASMRGFATQKLSDDRQYLKLLTLLEKLGSAESKNVFHEHAWKSNQSPENDDLGGVNRILDSQFYAPQESKHAEALPLIRPDVRPSDFTVIVTDLLWDPDDADQVADRITKEMNAFDRALGVVAISLPFDGSLKLSPSRGSIDYRGNRPLYVLFFGDRRVVEGFNQALKDQLQRQLIEYNAFVLEKHFVSQPFTSADAHLAHLVGCARGGLTTMKEVPPSLQLTLVPDALEGSARIEFPLNHAPDGLFFNPGVIDYSPDVYFWKHGKWEEMSSERLVMNCRAHIQEEVVDQSEVKLGRKLVFDITMSPDVFYERGLYYVKLSFRTKPWELKLPDWVSAANIDLQEQDDDNNSQRLGGRTPGLSRFLDRIREGVLQENEVVGNAGILLKRE